MCFYRCYINLYIFVGQICITTFKKKLRYLVFCYCRWINLSHSVLISPIFFLHLISWLLTLILHELFYMSLTLHLISSGHTTRLGWNVEDEYFSADLVSDSEERLWLLEQHCKKGSQITLGRRIKLFLGAVICSANLHHKITLSERLSEK